MSNYLHNINCPPTSDVRFSFLRINQKFIVISSSILAAFFNCKKENLIDELNKYVLNHQNELDKYFIDKYILVKRYSLYSSDLRRVEIDTKGFMRQYNVTTTPNINLLISLLGRIVGDLYIPNRKISFSEEILDKLYVVPMEGKI